MGISADTDEQIGQAGAFRGPRRTSRIAAHARWTRDGSSLQDPSSTGTYMGIPSDGRTGTVSSRHVRPRGIQGATKVAPSSESVTGGSGRSFLNGVSRIIN
jgi:hypothetical protein